MRVGGREGMGEEQEETPQDKRRTGHTGPQGDRVPLHSLAVFELTM